MYNRAENIKQQISRLREKVETLDTWLKENNNSDSKYNQKFLEKAGYQKQLKILEADLEEAENGR